MTINDCLQYLATGPQAWVTVLVLFLSALIEYVFPPFPGDTVTLAGAFLAFAYDFPLAAAFIAVLAGGTIGAAADYWLGTLLDRGSRSRLMRLGIVRKAMEGAEKASAAFARHGEAYIAINRFLPGIRAFLFVAAGMARMRFWRVMFFAALSNLAWNILVFTAGYAVGSNVDLLEEMFRQYSQVVWAALGVVTVVLAGRWWWRNRTGIDLFRRRTRGKPGNGNREVPGSSTGEPP